VSIEFIEHKDCNWRLAEALWVVRIQWNGVASSRECMRGWELERDHVLGNLVLVDSKILLYDRMRDCPLPEASPESKWRDCVVDRIVYFEEQLKSHDTDKKQNVIALKFLVHLIGDIHQPFHAIGDAHGSNNIHVVFLGTTQCGEHSLCNLHGVWDESLLEHHNWKEKKYLAMLRSEILENNWKKQDEGDPAAWANTSHRYAQDAFVDNGALISSKYYEAEIKIVDQQLALGGLRLAEVLNGIFTLSPPPK
jgi:S1/P1 Nuclease